MIKIIIIITSLIFTILILLYFAINRTIENMIDNVLNENFTNSLKKIKKENLNEYCIRKPIFLYDGIYKVKGFRFKDDKFKLCSDKLLEMNKDMPENVNEICPKEDDKYINYHIDKDDDIICLSNDL